MPDMTDLQSTVVSRVVNAPREAVYRAFLDQDALVAWLPPGSMQGVVHAFDGREGGTFRISLVYPEAEGRRAARPPSAPTPSAAVSSNWSPTSELSGRRNSNRRIRHSRAR
jgi:uncharacterized protein YndB with AHSA1/START domain